MGCNCCCSGSTVIDFDKDGNGAGLTACCVEPWEDFVDNLIDLGITTVDFCTHNQAQETNETPLNPIVNSILTIGNFIIPVCQLVGLRFTVNVNEITDSDVLAGLTPPTDIEGECAVCEAPLRLVLDNLQAIGNPIEIDTVGTSQFESIMNVTVAGTGLGIVVAKEPQMGMMQTYYILTICNISNIEV
ncbi:hypothetical protein SH1V18_16240 [Vallitalea longa]|uniref:Uncharacterized protein n=1 Tax=Vallitalea longa TaxID=2936439 RepID=A0A9W5Y9P6_9FIRM|nr:hypothetical protein [Vallitalea longa]GKX29144.1 hypothetical protein SH1V18_16240 [Vallitalea longa]